MLKSQFVHIFSARWIAVVLSILLSAVVSYAQKPLFVASNRGLPPSIGAAPVTPVLALASSPVEPNLIYAATEVDGIYRSEDSGQSWIRASKGLPVPLERRTVAPLLAVDGSNPQWVYTLLRVPIHSHRIDALLYRSSDSGKSWQILKEFERDPGFESMAVETPRRLRLTGPAGTETLEDLLPETRPPIPDRVQLWREAPRYAIDSDSDSIAVVHDEGGLILRSFSLNRRSIEFRPARRGAYDVVSTDTVFQPELGTRLELTNDGSSSVTLPFPFPFYGNANTSVFVNANGNLTFQTSSATSAESSEGFFSGPPRIAPLWDDLNPASGGGGVFVNSSSGEVVITWSQVPEAGTTNSNTLQVELFPDGAIRFNFNSVAAADGLTGISNGSVTSGRFVNLGETSNLKNLAGPIHELWSRTALNATAITRRFYQIHGDDYDAVFVFGASELRTGLAGGFTAFYASIRNDVRGIGRSILNASSMYGSAGRLQGYINMNRLAGFPNDFTERIGTNNDNTLTLLGQEWGHRFLANVRFRDGGGASSDLLGRGGSHWNYFFNSEASVMEGNEWRDNSDGTFTTTDDTQRYGPLDQYLMGLRSAPEVPPLMLVTSPQPILEGNVDSVISTFGRTNNAIRDPNTNFGARDRWLDFRVEIEGASATTLTSANTAAVTSSGRTESGTDLNVINTGSNLSTQFMAQPGKRYFLRKLPDSSPRSHFFDPGTLRFTAENLVFRGTKKNLTVEDIIAQEGERNPPAGQAQTHFRHAFILVVPKGSQANAADIRKLAAMRRAWETFYAEATDRRGSVSTDLDTNFTRVPFPLNNGGGHTFTTTGSGTTVNVGYGTLTAGNERTSGVAIFSSRSGDRVVSEAAVAATGLVSRARFFAERNSGINTGFAAASPSGPAVLSLTLRDSSGETIATATQEIPSRGQAAKFVHELFASANLPASFRGSVSVESSAPVAIVALRTIVNQDGEFLITTLPVANLNAAATSNPLYLPQVADSEGYVTEVLLVNAGSSPLTGTAEFRRSNGSEMNITVNGAPGANTRYNIPPNGSQVLTTSGSAASVQTGYLVIRPDPSQNAPISAAVFTLTQGSLLVAATGVAPARLSTRVRLFIDRTEGHDTGIAVVNPSNQSAALQLSLTSLSGAAGNTSTLPLNSRHHTSKFISELDSTVPVGFRGTLEVTSPVPIAVLALRSTVSGGRFLLSTLPVDSLDAGGPPETLYFPHLADGGEFTTEFVILNLGRTSILTSLTFSSPEGTALLIGFR